MGHPALTTQILRANYNSGHVHIFRQHAFLGQRSVFVVIKRNSSKHSSQSCCGAINAVMSLVQHQCHLFVWTHERQALRLDITRPPVWSPPGPSPVITRPSVRSSPGPQSGHRQAPSPVAARPPVRSSPGPSLVTAKPQSDHCQAPVR